MLARDGRHAPVGVALSNSAGVVLLDGIGASLLDVPIIEGGIGKVSETISAFVEKAEIVILFVALQHHGYGAGEYSNP